MSRKAVIPTEDKVRATLTTLEAQGSAPVSVVALARELGLANATFWRHFPDVAQDVAEARRLARAGHLSGPQAEAPKVAEEVARLRRGLAESKAFLEIAVANIQRLSIENHELRRELELARGVTVIGPPK